MTHQESIDNHTAERYFLGELGAAERGAFEEHYFDCHECADDVRDEAQVISGVRAIGRGAHGRHNFIPTLAAAASFAVAVATIGYQQFGVIQPLRAQLAKEHEPRIVRIVDVREKREARPVVNGGAAFVLEFAIPPDRPSPQYAFAVVDAQGKNRFSGSVTAEQAQKPIDVQVPGGLLRPGDHKLKVTGTGGVPVVEMGFEVR